jgi:hypothetical protein
MLVSDEIWCNFNFPEYGKGNLYLYLLYYNATMNEIISPNVYLTTPQSKSKLWYELKTISRK